MRISLGQRAHDAHPTTVECSWPDLVNWLYQHPRGTGDKDGPYICLAEFMPHAAGHTHPRACDNAAPYRNLGYLVASCGIPLDFDNGRVSADTIRATLQGYAWVAYTTYKHTHDAPRWRVFVPLATSVDAATHKATWVALNAAFQGLADAAASDASRLSYLPGACIDPADARIIHADGAFYPPTQAAAPAPVVTGHGDGPVPGWAGPADDVQLLTIACNTRLKVGERFGEPIHMAMLWSGNSEWLAQHYPPTNDDATKGRAWDYTRADAELANELLYYTGGDRERSANLMRQSALAAVRQGDEDWASRKVYAALALGMNGRGLDQFHFMGAVPAGTAVGTTAPAPPADTPAPGLTPAQAALMNVPVGASVRPDEFFAFLPDHTYIHRPSGVRCSAASVDELIGKEARAVLAPTVPVHKFTWAPGYPERFTLDALDGQYLLAEQVWLYNEYRRPRPHTKPDDPSRWLELIRRLYPEDAEHIVSYFADAVQFPGRKCNHALVLGSGVHGIGKDTLLSPLEYAVGLANFAIIKPAALGSDFNPFVRHVVVQLSESRDLGEGYNSLSRYEMYERCKDLAAAPPSTLECNEKNKGQYPVANVLRLIITTNHQVDGLHMDPNDRRHYCAWSDAEKMSEEDSKAIWAWYESGGKDAVAHYLSTLDLDARGWNPKAPPIRTAWWYQLVAGGTSAEEEKFSDALDKMGRPEWTTTNVVGGAGGPDLTNWIQDPRNRRKVEREMTKSGYQRLPNANEPKRGRWTLSDGTRVIVYRRNDVPAKTLVRAFGGTP